MKIGILGAGISGLSIGKLLSSQHEVEILERHMEPGGIAKTKNFDGIPYHTVGGHCFNSKHLDVLAFVFSKILPEEKWDLIQRKSSIQFKNREISYPIEFAVREIHAFNPELAYKIIEDYLIAQQDLSNVHNLEDWFVSSFGKTLAEEYFIPYNRKIWNIEPKEMSHEWVKEKLPIPDRKAFMQSLFNELKDNMSHRLFYYPKNNQTNTFIKALADGLKILFGYNVFSIRYSNRNKKWIINDTQHYDLIINTLPLNIVPSLIENCPLEIVDEAQKLRYNRITTMLWESAQTSNTWTYIPEPESIFHRYIHISNFAGSQKSYTITEAVGERSYDEMANCGRKDPFLKTPLDHNVSDHAYVVFDKNYNTSKDTILKYLKQIGIYTLGRFGEWDYYNMDICIKKSLELYKLLQDEH
ncbi:nucleotidyl-sugar pyranose mutase [Pelobium manganitolerans]|uniref:Nucleotidyl-sugar pyranose mutase n=1 Tax=Pelobium manganitolerans TaxID=1842495 RepID=A0A419SAQ8_9SPHI|nr:NAD(P)-binding protein [Pelobium manganitolerans]RKD19554.1 nucleotidyl-sugar pyranose mutase [Pelobium manganitolerans]